MQRLVTEGLGTFLLVLVVTLTGNPISIAFALMALVYAGGPISGGHYNPAVTLAVWRTGALSALEAGRYCASQLVGGLLAGVVYLSLAGQAFVPQPGENVSLAAAGMLEVIFSFFLAITVLQTAVAKTTRNNQYYGMAIGAALGAAIAATAPISGGVLNPAVVMGAIALDPTGFSEHISNFILYVVAPLGGGLLAAAFYSLRRP